MATTWDPQEFQAFMRRLLTQHGWSQNELAMRAGISQAAVNRWLQQPNGETPAGLTRPRPSTLERLAVLAGVPHNDLMRMCGYIQADPKTKRRDVRLAALISDIEAKWEVLDEQEREHADHVSRVGFKLYESHHARIRRSRTSRGNSNQHYDSISSKLAVA